jgi:uncharacterized protein (DUF983 family)
MPPTASQKWWALLRQRCPHCCQGRIYAGGMTMHQRCPVCNLRFEREPGYFMGSLYIGYALAVAILMLWLWIGSLLMPEVDLGWIVLICIALFVPLAPLVTRYARVIWMFFDHWAWPARPEELE